MNTTTLRHTDDLASFQDCMLAEEYLALVEAGDGAEVIVHDEVLDGYYNVTVNGVDIEALSWWHLEGYPNPSNLLY